MGILYARVNGAWVAISQGVAPPKPLFVNGTGGTVTAAQGNVTVLSLTTPAYAAPAMLVATWSLRVSQPTAGAFDVTFNAPTNGVLHQFGGGVESQGRVLSFTRIWTANGTALSFNTQILAWGGNSVTWDSASNITITVWP